LHKLVWRFFFKDLQIRGLSKSLVDTKFQGTSFEGRIYLTIGYGTLDRLYRRWTKTEKPEVATIYFRTGLRSPTLLNPFKVLASCHKGYVRQPIGTRRIVTDGLFKRTLIATHKRRDTEDNSTVYWFELERYDQKLFDSQWYEGTHKAVIKSGLDKVSKACLMDSTVQKHQMENVIAWVPEVEINEHKAIHALKQEKMPLQVEQ
jgi:hypothetical protein